jgi:tetratricopeptide (TPR) repeat protein
MTAKKLSFYIIACAIPFLILGMVEWLLRVSGFGQIHPLFIPFEAKPGWVQTNPDVVKRYFATPELAPQVAPDTQLFTLEKPTETTRIVVMGGSSAAGFPYGRFGSPAGFMQQRLHGLYPERHIEVISVALSSVNSYTLRDFVPEIQAIEPDAIYIYAGHNEYLGIMGVGSNYVGYGSHALNVAFLALKEWRLVQLLQRVLYPTDSANTASNGRTVMASIAKTANIPLESEIYHAGLAQFADNMQAILDAFEQANTPVYLSTIASNLADQIPFAGPYELTLDDGSKVNKATLTRLSAEQINRLAKAHPHHPFVKYAQAHAWRTKDPQRALALYTQARDLDVLRFRAPSAINAIISDISASRPFVYRVDGEAMLAQYSPDEIIGQSLMLEHLHPNDRGYFLLAEAALATMIETAFLPPAPLPETREQAWEHAWISPADHYFARHKIHVLTADYPFVDEPLTLPTVAPNNALEALGAQRISGKQDWLSQQRALVNFAQQQNDPLLAANTLASLFTALPFDAKIAWQTANAYRLAKSYDYAHYFIERAIKLNPNHIQTLLTKAEILFHKRRFTAALDALDKVLQLEPQHPQAPHYQRLIRQAQQEQ